MKGRRYFEKHSGKSVQLWELCLDGAQYAIYSGGWGRNLVGRKKLATAALAKKAANDAMLAKHESGFVYIEAADRRDRMTFFERGLSEAPVGSYLDQISGLLGLPIKTARAGDNPFYVWPEHGMCAFTPRL
jgi:hypothetical protein